MSMMVNRVSNVSFRANEQPLPEDFLTRPGAFTKPAQEEPAQKPAKKHKALKVIVGTIVAAAVIAGGLYAAHKYGSKTFDATKNFADIKNIEGYFEKAKAYVTTAIGKGGQKVEKGVNYIAENCKALWTRIANSKKPEPNPSDPVALLP